MFKKISTLVMCLTVTIFALQSYAGGYGHSVIGNVYTMTNSEDGNKIVIFNRLPQGKLIQVGSVKTGGLGGNNEVPVDPLGSQNSLILSHNRNFLFAVNNGSNEISSFRILRHGQLKLVDRVSSHGLSPVSLAMDNDDRLFVLNSRGSGSIATFDVDRKGRLSLVPNSVFDLNLSEANVADMNVAPGQIALDRLNRRVLLTNGLLGTLTSYTLDNNGLILAEEDTANLSTGLPFAVALTRFGHALVAQAAVIENGGPVFNTGALSSIDLDAAFSTSVEIVSDSVSNGQSGSCWVVTDGNQFAFTSNTFSDTISSYRFNREGQLELIEGEAAFTNDGPLDLGLTRNGRFLYVLNAGDGTAPSGPNEVSSNPVGGNISAYRVNLKTGALTLVGVFGRLPASASIQGIAVL